MSRRNIRIYPAGANLENVLPPVNIAARQGYSRYFGNGASDYDPLRAINITANSANMYDWQAALCEDIIANSTWTVTHNTEITTGSQGRGSFSFCMQSPSGHIEIVFLNSGTQGTPDTLDCRVGINPDGSGDPVTDSQLPWLSALNFSGDSKAIMRNAWHNFSVASMHAQFAYWEWDDAIAVGIKNSGRTTYSQGFHAGQVCHPLFRTGKDGLGSMAFDGLGIFGHRPRAEEGSLADTAHWLRGRGSGTYHTLRFGLGQTIGFAVGGAFGWTTNPAAPAGGSVVWSDAMMDVGLSNEYVPGPHKRGVGRASGDAGINLMDTKYILRIKDTATMTVITSPVSGEDVMISFASLSSSEMALPIPDGYVVNP